MHKVYSKRDPASTESIDEILSAQYQFLRKNTTKAVEKISIKEVMCGEKYRRATWVCVVINSLN